MKSLNKISDKQTKGRGKRNLCDCGKKGKKLHTCPYQEDIKGDSETVCNCCDECEQNCMAEI